MAAPQGSRPLGAGMAPAVRRAAAWAGLAAAVLTGATACVGGPAAEPPDRSAPAALPTGGTPVALAPSSFSTKIDNRYWPMAPGDRWIYDEVDADGVVSRNVVTVTSATKKVAAGIDGRVVRDTLTLNGQIVEDTFDWYAEDAGGTVWYLGEDTAEFENGTVSSREGSFEAGKDGALAGVILPAQPAVGMAYRQEYYRGEAEDNGEVLSVHELAEVPAGAFRNVLLTKETTPVEPDVLEYKLYAPDVGPVMAFGVSGDHDREQLTEVTTVPRTVASAAASTPLGQPYD